ncbi:MAG: addiction module protein [Proteobacteria bacterium]|nr:addiction module protein [Pseudomonadota bacterium]
MSDPVEEILAQLPHLSAEERAVLRAELDAVEQSSDSPEEIEAAWRDEIVRRIRSIQSGEAELVDGADMMRRLRAKTRR